jgi:DNA-directed RNA polymerase I and III subunit RPAC1
VRRLLEQESWKERLQLRKRKDHIIFTVESTGTQPAATLLRTALTILEQKCERLANRL